MSANSRFSKMAAVLLGFFFLGSTGKAAAETEVLLAPHVTTVINNSKTDLEAGFELTPWGLRLRVLGKTPLTNADDEPSLVQFDETTSSWRVASLVEYEVDFTGMNGDIQFLRLGMTGDWGIKDYPYFPNGGKTKENERKQSGAVGLRLAYSYKHGVKRGFHINPQLFFRSDHSWKAADKTGIVTPGDSNQPAMVSNKVIKGPSIAPLTTLRIFLPLYPGWNTPLAFGGAFSHGWANKDDGWFGGDVQRSRGELWLYFYPKEDDTTNVRLGLGPFYDWRSHGSADDDDQEKHVYGLLVQLRVGTLPLEY